MKQSWWVSCGLFTVQVDTMDGIILRAAPIVRVFVGQPFERLLRWRSNTIWEELRGLDEKVNREA